MLLVMWSAAGSARVLTLPAVSPAMPTTPPAVAHHTRPHRSGDRLTTASPTGTACARDSEWFTYSRQTASGFVRWVMRSGSRLPSTTARGPGPIIFAVLIWRAPRPCP